MKGLIVKKGTNVWKAGIPYNGVGVIVNISRYNGVFWSISGVQLPEETHITWYGGELEVGDEIEIELAEFDEATSPIVKASHQSLLKKASEVAGDTDDWSRELDIYYRLKSILEEERIIEKE